MENGKFLQANISKIGDRILQRGRQVYENDAVTFLSFEDGHCEAEVQGTDLYHVEIDYNEHFVITNSSCSCPYGQMYNNICKHRVATLMKMDEGIPFYDYASSKRQPKEENPETTLPLDAYVEALKSEQGIISIINTFLKGGLQRKTIANFELFVQIAFKAFEYGNGIAFIEESEKTFSQSTMVRFLEHLLHLLKSEDQIEFFRWMIQDRAPEDPYRLLAIRFMRKQSRFIAGETFEAVYSFFSDQELAMLFGGDTYPSTALVSFATRHSYLKTLIEILRRNLYTGSAPCLVPLWDSIDQLKPDVTFFQRLLGSFQYHELPVKALSYFTKFSKEEQREILRSIPSYPPQVNANTLRLIAGESCPQTQTEFNGLSLLALQICKPQIVSLCDRAKLKKFLPKYFEQAIKKMRQTGMANDETIRNLFATIKAYLDFPEVVQILKNPTLDDLSLEGSSLSRIAYLSLIQDMPSFAGLRRY